MSALTERELKDIAEYVKKLGHICGDQSKNDLIFEWTKTGRITRHQHLLLCQFVFQDQTQG